MAIAFLAHRAPYPPDRGDKIRSWNVLRYLAARADVHLFAFAEDPADLIVPPMLAATLSSARIVPRTKSRGRALAEALAKGRPVSLSAFDDPAMRRAVARARADRLYCFSGQMAQYLPADVPAVMDFVDVDSAKFAALAADTQGPMRWLYRREAERLGRYERAVATRVEASLFVSDAEAALFRGRGATGRIATVENGIDAAAFDLAMPMPIPPGGGAEIVFTGQMDYRPNIDAVRWFADAVLPRVRAERPGIRFAIVGRAPTAAVRALHGRDGIVVTGEVADVRPWLANARVCVAPLKLARGIQNKVLEAMAMARPVIASPSAAEGIDHAGTIRVADGVEAWVATIDGLLDDRDAAAALGAAARRRVLDRYDWSARLRPLDALLGLGAPLRRAA